MAINFPDSPTNGDTFTANGVVYTYNATAALWDTISAAAAVDFTAIASNILPDADSSRDLGSTTKKWKDLHLSGNTIHLGDTQLKGSGGKLTVADSTGTVINPFNVAPRFTTSPAAELVLGSPDSGRITAVAVDEAGFPITYDWDGYKDSGGSTTIYKDGSLPPQVSSITQPTAGVFRFTNDSANGTNQIGSFNFRVKASDGALVSTASTTVSLAFETIITIAARQTRSSNYVEPTSTGVTQFNYATAGSNSHYNYFPEGATASAAGWPTGKRYIEAKWTSTEGAFGSFMLGVGERTASHNNASTGGYTGGTGTTSAYAYADNGNTYSLSGNNQTSGLGAYVLNDVFTIAYDTDAEKVWFGKNGTWGSTCGDPGAGGVGFSLSYANEGYAFVVASASNNGGNDFTITWGGSDYTIPTGFSNF